LFVDDVRTSQETHLWAFTACYGNSFTSLYMDDIRTSKETHLWASMDSYRESSTLLYVDDVRTSLKTHFRASTARCGDNFAFYCSGSFQKRQNHKNNQSQCSKTSAASYMSAALPIHQFKCSQFLGYSAVYSVCGPTFRRNVSLPSTGAKNSRARNQLAAGEQSLLL
jgi:uncharacterized protein YcgI (DUF1989 family)